MRARKIRISGLFSVSIQRKNADEKDLELQNKKGYKIPEGYMQLEVVSNRYE